MLSARVAPPYILSGLARKYSDAIIKVMSTIVSRRSLRARASIEERGKPFEDNLDRFDSMMGRSAYSLVPVEKVGKPKTAGERLCVWMHLLCMGTQFVATVLFCVHANFSWAMYAGVIGGCFAVMQVSQVVHTRLTYSRALKRWTEEHLNDIRQRGIADKIVSVERIDPEELSNWIRYHISLQLRLGIHPESFKFSEDGTASRC